MNNRKLHKFIKAERSKGVGDDTIRIMFAANGWTQLDIKNAYASLKSDSGSKKNSKWWILIVLIIVAFLVAWVAYK